MQENSIFIKEMFIFSYFMKKKCKENPVLEIWGLSFISEDFFLKKILSFAILSKFYVNYEIKPPNMKENHSK